MNEFPQSDCTDDDQRRQSRLLRRERLRSGADEWPCEPHDTTVTATFNPTTRVWTKPYCTCKCTTDDLRRDMAWIEVALSSGAHGNGAQRDQEPKPLSYALAYARHGYRVFPLHEIEADCQCSCGKLECSSAGKHPRFSGWQESATTDEGQIREWWHQHPTANIGVKCGADSDLTVLDVDEGGRETLRTLELEHGELPETPIAITGSGWEHRYFQFEEGLQNAVKFAPGLDIRTEGGLVVGVRSKTRLRYEWEVAFTPSDELKPARMPGWLANLIRVAADKSKSNGAFHVDEEIPSGRRNETLYKLGRSLKARGLCEAAIQAALREENIAKCRPPLTRDEVDQIAQHCFEAADRPGFEANAEEKREVPAGLVTLNVEQLLQRQAEPREFLIEPVLREKDLAMIYSWRGLGKTMLALELAYAIASGGPCLRWHAPRPRRVLYIDGELAAGHQGAGCAIGGGK